MKPQILLRGEAIVKRLILKHQANALPHFIWVRNNVEAALHKKSWAVIDRPYSLGCATVGALYERPRCIFCAKPIGAVGQRITIEDHEIPEFARLESAKILGAADHRRGIAGHD